MSAREKCLWAELALWLAILLFIWVRLTDGVVFAGQSIGLTVVDQEPRRLLWAYGSAGALLAIGQLAIRAFVFRREPSDPPADERDRFIERKSDQAAYWTGVTAINILITHVLLTDLFAPAGNRVLDFTSPAGILLGLTTVLIAQEVSKAVSALILYKTS